MNPAVVVLVILSVWSALAVGVGLWLGRALKRADEHRRDDVLASF